LTALDVTARFTAPGMHGAADGEAIRFAGRAAFENTRGGAAASNGWDARSAISISLDGVIAIL
jgi:hypothetical protein